MIRRTFWLAAGAALGIAGYRKIGHAAQSLTVRPQAALPVAATGAVRAVRKARAARARRQAERSGSQASGFLADVRAGMDEYLDQANISRQGSRSRNTLVGQRAAIEARVRPTDKAAPDS